MIEVSETIKNLYQSDTFNGDVSFTIDSATYTASNILASSASITESVSSGEDIDFRSVEKSCLEITLINITENIKELKGKTLTMKQTVLGTDVPLGVYTIDDAVNDGDYLYDITAYDNLYKFDVDVSDWWNTEVVFPISLRDLLISLCTKVGVSYNFPTTFTNSDFQVQKNIYVEETTGTDFLGYIQEACAGFIKPDRTGVMKLIQLVYLNEHGLYPDVTIFPSETLYPLSRYDASSATPSAVYNVPITIDKLQLADYTVAPITKLQIRGTADDIGIVVGSGDNAYIIEANPLFYSFTGSNADSEVAQKILDIICELTYIPVTTKVKALPYIEVGDLIRFISYEGKESYAPLLHRSLGGFLFTSDAISIKGREKRNNRVQSVNKTTKILNQRMHELTNTVEEFGSRIVRVETDLDGVTTTIDSKISQSADNITTEVAGKLEGYVTDEEFGTRLTQNQAEVIAQVWSSEEGQQLIQAFLTLNKYGLTVTTDNDNSSARINGSGVLVLKQVGNTNYVVAKFTRDESYTNNLTVATFLSFGAHRWEAILGTEGDGVVSMGTGAAWTGEQEELMENMES